MLSVVRMHAAPQWQRVKNLTRKAPSLAKTNFFAWFSSYLSLVNYTCPLNQFCIDFHLAQDHSVLWVLSTLQLCLVLLRYKQITISVGFKATTKLIKIETLHKGHSVLLILILTFSSTEFSLFQSTAGKSDKIIFLDPSLQQVFIWVGIAFFSAG